jgi:hypothetical protein
MVAVSQWGYGGALMIYTINIQLKQPLRIAVRRIEPGGAITQTLTFVTQWGYNSVDAVAWMQYPGGGDGSPGETVSYTYDNRLAIVDVSGADTYLSSATYDAAGRMAERVLGASAVTTQYGYYPWTTMGGWWAAARTP